MTIVRRILRVLAGLLGIVLGFLLAAVAALALWPLGLSAPLHASNPAASYDAAITAFAALNTSEGNAPLNDRCRPVLLTHGQKVAKVVVLFHGLTNCPAQWDALAPMLYAKGYNVLVARLPGHGYQDTLTDALALVTAEDFAASANAAVDVAQGLGDKVDVVGLSAGGAMGALLAQTRSDVDKVVAIAPFFAPLGLPNWAIHTVANLLRVVPNQMIWWNPSDPVGQADMSYAYPRYATHVIGELMRLGQVIDAEATRTAPKSPHPEMLLNEADPAISAAAAMQLAAAWQAKGANLIMKTIPADQKLPHDLIDPRQLTANTGYVYPIIIGMLNDSAN